MTATVLVRAFEVRKTSAQKNYGSLRLNRGREGNFEEVEAKLWDLDAALARGRALPAAGDLLRVEYRADEYQGRPQWILQDFAVVDGEARRRELANFTPPTRIDRAFYQRRLDDLIDATSPERMPGILLREVFDRAGFREQFYLCPAARDHHQNYPGGLLEHTLNVVTVALAMADAYAAAGRPGLTFNSQPLPIDREVLVAAGLLHDIGKLETYKLEPLPECTEAQNWSGHLVLSYLRVHEIARPWLEECQRGGNGACARADEIHKVLHCILSHHGSLEFGSPVTPACAEAFLLAQADMTDARLAEIASGGCEALARDPRARWLRGMYHFKGGVFVGDWGAGNQAGE